MTKRRGGAQDYRNSKAASDHRPEDGAESRQTLQNAKLILWVETLPGLLTAIYLAHRA